MMLPVRGNFSLNLL